MSIIYFVYVTKLRDASALEGYYIKKTIIGTTERKLNVLHALLEQRQTSCFTDEQISPLHDHNADEESRVAGKLQFFSLFITLKSVISII